MTRILLKTYSIGYPEIWILQQRKSTLTGFTDQVSETPKSYQFIHPCTQRMTLSREYRLKSQLQYHAYYLPLITGTTWGQESLSCQYFFHPRDPSASITSSIPDTNSPCWVGSTTYVILSPAPNDIYITSVEWTRINGHLLISTKIQLSPVGKYPSSATEGGIPPSAAVHS